MIILSSSIARSSIYLIVAIALEMFAPSLQQASFELLSYNEIILQENDFISHPTSSTSPMKNDAFQSLNIFLSDLGAFSFTTWGRLLFLSPVDGCGCG